MGTMRSMIRHNSPKPKAHKAWKMLKLELQTRARELQVILDSDSPMNESVAGEYSGLDAALTFMEELEKEHHL